ncbi:MAG: hypothetical protein OXH95_04570 [bacterium]|nr:hypothetical protein [bacterium]MCY3652158.1 hypothetical protein [bacterium]MDE0643403.1 hypothetical protein [bacterium]
MADFAHQSESEFSRLLDFYQIRWEYEPESFPIEWDEEGRVIQSFTPDFYLPDDGTYIEITTMKQSLVNRKNRKVRLFRYHYPELSVKLLYRRDYYHLVLKYGLDIGPLPDPELLPKPKPGSPKVLKLPTRG